jgi:hypothetical protein
MAGGTAIAAAKMFTKTGAASRVSVAKEITIGLVLGMGAGLGFKVREREREREEMAEGGGGPAAPLFFPSPLPLARLFWRPGSGWCAPVRPPACGPRPGLGRWGMAGAGSALVWRVRARDQRGAREDEAQADRKGATSQLAALPPPRSPSRRLSHVLALHLHPYTHSRGTGMSGARSRTSTRRWRRASEKREGGGGFVCGPPPTCVNRRVPASCSSFPLCPAP